MTMPKMSAAQIRNATRNAIVKEIIAWRVSLGDDAQQTKGNKLMWPALDIEGNEIFVELTVSIPTGARDDDEKYNGYAEAENFVALQEEKEAKRKAKEAESQRRAAEAKAKREEKKRLEEEKKKKATGDE